MYLNLLGQNVFFQKVGHGKNLIMLHGWSNNVSSFWPLLDNLMDNFTIWLIDLPGFGQSDTPKNSFSTSDYAEIIKEFIDKNNIKKASLVGHSLGGRIGIKLASKYPNIIDKLILEASAGIKPKRDSLKTLLYVGAKVFKYLIPNLFGLKTRIRHKFYKSLEADYLNAGKLTPTLTKILAEDLTTDLPKIKNETLIIWGEKDQAVPLKYGKEMYRLIPNSKIEVLENIGHFPHLENLKMFLYFLKDFLD